MKFIETLTEWMLTNNIIEEENKEVYAFGLRQFVSYLTHFVSIIFVGIIMGMIWQSMVFMISYMLIRPYAGGYHSRTPLRCYLISLFIISFVLLLIKHVPINLFVLIILFVVSNIVIFSLAPVEDENKPLDKIEQVVYRKRSNRALFIVSSVNIALLIFGMNDISICIVLALSILSVMLVVAKIKNLFFRKREE